MKVNVLSAQTAVPNTPETDRMRYIPHRVAVEIDGERYFVVVSAQDPGDAIDRVHNMRPEHVKALAKPYSNT